MRIVGFGAHPDDAEIFFFGMLAAAKATGAEVGWVIATDGSRGGTIEAAELRRMRHAEALAGGAVLGVTPVFLDREDGTLAGDTALIGLVGAAIGATAPDLIVTHAPNDYHPDHRALSLAVRAAAGFRVPVLYADTLMGNGFEPTLWVDIGAHMEAKRAAIRAHTSQDPERFVAACDTWNRFRALQANAPEGYAEAYRFEPSYPFADLRALLPPPPPVRPLGVAGKPPVKPASPSRSGGPSTSSRRGSRRR